MKFGVSLSEYKETLEMPEITMYVRKHNAQGLNSRYNPPTYPLTKKHHLIYIFVLHSTMCIALIGATMHDFLIKVISLYRESIEAERLLKKRAAEEAMGRTRKSPRRNLSRQMEAASQQ